MAKKRANGEGNIRKRKDGRWEGRYTAGHDPETGKAIYKNVLAKTQKECKEKLAAALEQVGKVDAHKTGQFTVGQWAEIWFENYAKPAIREIKSGFCERRSDCMIVRVNEENLQTAAEIYAETWQDTYGALYSESFIKRHTAARQKHIWKDQCRVENSYICS